MSNRRKNYVTLAWVAVLVGLVVLVWQLHAHRPVEGTDGGGVYQLHTH